MSQGVISEKSPQPLGCGLGRGLRICFWFSLLNRVGRSLETMHCLLQGPLQHALGVVAVSENVIAGRQTMRRALFLHLVQLGVIELWILNRAPVVRRRVHREARRQSPVRANDQRVLSGAAFPRWHTTTHELLHLLPALAPVAHLVAFLG